MGRDKLDVAKLLQRHNVIVKGGADDGRKLLDALVVSSLGMAKASPNWKAPAAQVLVSSEGFAEALLNWLEWLCALYMEWSTRLGQAAPGPAGTHLTMDPSACSIVWEYGSSVLLLRDAWNAMCRLCTARARLNSSGGLLHVGVETTRSTKSRPASMTMPTPSSPGMCTIFFAEL